MNKFGLIGLSALLALGSALPGSALCQQKSLKERLSGAAWLRSPLMSCLPMARGAIYSVIIRKAS